MEGKHFDQVIKRLGTGSSRRHVVGSVIGATAALLTGATVLEAKKGAKGGGKTKKSVCHFSNGHGGKYKKLTLGGPGADNHVANHPNDGYFGEVAGCCPGDTCTPQGQCFTAACTKDTTTSTFSCVSTPAVIGTDCKINNLPGACNGTGLCCDLVDPTLCVA
jgi:hypothetical protein